MNMEEHMQSSASAGDFFIGAVGQIEPVHYTVKNREG